MNTNYKRLYRSRNDKMISGLCAGLGEYVGMDPTVIRVIFAFAGILAFPVAELIYFVMMLIVPEEPAGQVVPPVVSPVDVIEQ